MGSNFEDLQGLAYPPNVRVDIEPWMERVRVTLERLLRTVTGGPQVIDLDLDVDDAGNVTASITANLSTEWIKYYVLTSGFPTTTQIDTLGSDIDMTAANAGVTQTTGTIVTLTDGQVAYVGVLAYEADDGVTGTGDVSTPMYSKITFGLDTDTTAFVPTVQADASVSGTTGTLLLTINDPGAFVNEVAFKKWEGASWTGYVVDATPPYTTTITVQEKHNVLIGWRVQYDSGAGNVYIEDTVTFDMDLIPELSSLSLSVDHTTGDVLMDYSGDDDVGSVRYAVSGSAYPNLTTTRAGAVIAGRTTNGTTVASALGEGLTEYVSVLAYSDGAGGGIEGGELYGVQATRHVDTDIQVPTVTVTPSVSGTTGTLTLVLNDPDSAVNLVGFRKWEGATWSAWVDDVTPAFLLVETITLQEKHNVAIGWRVQYDLGTGDGNQMLGNTVEFDVDETPELASMLLSIDHTTGDVTLDYNGDDDVGSIRYADDDVAYPNLATTQAGTVVAGRSTSGTVVQAGIAEGATRYVSVLAYTDGAGGGTVSTELYTGQVTRHTDSIGSDTQIPSAIANITGPGAIELLVQDDDGYLTGVGFQKFTGGSWGSWVDDTVPAYTLTASVTLEEKHTTAIGWRLLYDIGSGTKYTGGSVTFDPDLIPEIQNMGLDVDHTTGDVTLEWNGDDDVASIRYVDDDAAYQSLAATQAGTPANGRSGTVVVQSAIAEGTSRFVTVLAYNAADGLGIESNVLYRAKVTRHTDTDTLPSTLPEITALQFIVRNTGKVMFHYAGNENTASIRWAERDQTAGPYASTEVAYTAAKAGILVAAQSSINVVVNGDVAIAEGDTHYIAVVAYDNAGGTDPVVSEVAYTAEIVRPLTDLSNANFGGLLDVTITGTPATGEIPAWTGSIWENNTLAEAGIEPDLGVPGGEGWHLKSTVAGVRSWEAPPIDSGTGSYNLFRRDGFTAMTARETFHLIGGTGITISAVDDAGNDETDITIDAAGMDLEDLDNVQTNAPVDGRMLKYTTASGWIDVTPDAMNIPERGLTESITGLWSFENATTNIGGTASLPDIIITDDGARDPRIRAPAGKMTLETLGSTTPTGDGLYIDDGGTNNAKVAGIKDITATATAPTGDYPYGTLHLIY